MQLNVIQRPCRSGSDERFVSVERAPNGSDCTVFPLAHLVPRVDDRRAVSGISYVIKHGLQWKDAPKHYRPHKTLYNRFIRRSRMVVFDRIFAGLAGEWPKPERIMIDVTPLKAHRTAASLLEKGMFPVVSGAQRVA